MNITNKLALALFAIAAGAACTPAVVQPNTPVDVTYLQFALPGTASRAQVRTLHPVICSALLKRVPGSICGKQDLSPQMPWLYENREGALRAETLAACLLARNQIFGSDSIQCVRIPLATATDPLRKYLKLSSNGHTPATVVSFSSVRDCVRALSGELSATGGECVSSAGMPGLAYQAKILNSMGRTYGTIMAPTQAQCIVSTKHLDSITKEHRSDLQYAECSTSSQNDDASQTRQPL